MARYLGPKVKLSRRVGVPIADIPKHTAKRQLTPPGMHGFRGRRPKDYGIRKNEKQKLRYHYNVLEKQLQPQMSRLLEVIRSMNEQYGEGLANSHPDLADAMCQCEIELNRYLNTESEPVR